VLREALPSFEPFALEQTEAVEEMRLVPSGVGRNQEHQVASFPAEGSLEEGKVADQEHPEVQVGKAGERQEETHEAEASGSLEVAD